MCHTTINNKVIIDRDAATCRTYDAANELEYGEMFKTTLRPCAIYIRGLDGAACFEDGCVYPTIYNVVELRDYHEFRSVTKLAGNYEIKFCIN